MAKITDSIIHLLGGVSKDEHNQDLTKNIEQVIEQKLKAGISQNGRPNMRAGFMKGMAIPPEKKIADYVASNKGWVYSCVKAISQEFANIELTLNRRKTQDKFMTMEKHPVLDLLYNVNPLYTSYLLYEATQAYIELTGECFWWLAGSTKQGYNAKEIWILRPDWVTIEDSKDKLIESYSYGPPGWTDRKIKIPFEQVIHFKDFNPVNPYRGHGVVKAAAIAIDTDEYAARYNRQFFYNDASPGGVIATENILQDDDYTRIRNEWEDVHKGSENSWKVAILEAGLTWQEVGLKQRDMQFIEGRKASRDEILAMFQVPKPILGVSDDVNRASAREARAVFLENVIEPKMRRFVSFLNEFLLPKYGDKKLFFDFVSPVPADQTVIQKNIELGMQHKFMTKNEARELLGMDQIEGGDELPEEEPVNQDPNASVDGSDNPEDDQNKPTKSVKYKPTTPKFNVRVRPVNETEEKIEKLQENIGKSAQDLVYLMVSQKTPGKPEGDEPKDDSREINWKAVMKRTDPRENGFRNKINDLMLQQRDKVLGRLDSGVDKKSVSKVKATVNDISDLDADNSVWLEVVVPQLKAMIEAEGIMQIQQLVQNAVFYMATKEVQNYLKDEGVRFIKAVNDETAELIRSQLIEGVDKGESIAKLRERISKVYEDATGYRSERIARTEVLRASNFATLEAYKQSGVVEAKEWLTAHDERVCPWCGPMDGKRLALGDDYFQEGDVVVGKNDKGKTVRLTIGLSNVSVPPLHPNCRCTVIPVVESDKNGGGLRIISKKSEEVVESIQEVAQAVVEEISKSEDVNKDGGLVDIVNEHVNKILEEKVKTATQEAEKKAEEIISEAKKAAESEKKEVLKEATELRDTLRKEIFDKA